MDLEFCLLVRPDRGLEEILAAHGIQKEVCAPIPTAHHVVDGPRVLDSKLARHLRHLANLSCFVNMQKVDSGAMEGVFQQHLFPGQKFETGWAVMIAQEANRSVLCPEFSS